MAQTQVAQAVTLRVQLVGRIKSATKRNSTNGTTFRTLINTPAPDAYGHPGTYEVRSLSSLGQIGSEVSVTCDLKGYARSYDGKDGETVNTAEHVLQAV
jgi:hypothetical protein